MNKYKFFSNADFEKATPSCSIEDIHPESLARLDKAREIAGIPFKVNSAYRTKSHELKQGRSGNSAHTLGRAFDIMCLSNDSRYRIVSAALKVGFTRIGIYKRFIHLDDSISHPTHRIWLGD